jgi:type II secretory pathway component PulJ
MHTTTRSSTSSKHVTGFTLVEMLVSVTLVLMMMMMFAQVFEIASGIHVKVRGITRNDQRTRILIRTLRSDLDKRTMRHATPFRQNEHLITNLADRDLDNRQGYFSVSENTLNNDLDDVLQFTARTSISLQNIDSTRFSGKSTGLGQAVLNQPDWDDGVPLDNSTESIAAEISYFLRAGTLFRRVLLLRQPAFGGDQPTDATGNPIMPAYTNQGRSFWSDFDSSAHFEPNLGGVQFHGLNSLDNSGSLANYPLGYRRYRFGHDHVTGNAREFDSSNKFIGRFTHEETSHHTFRYPAALPNPMDSGAVLTLNSETGVINEFSTPPLGPRRAEDIMMTNVHSVDVKILRDAAAPFGILDDPRDEYFDTRHPRDAILPAATSLPEIWLPNEPLTLVRSSESHHRHMGLWFLAKVAGTSGPIEPAWPGDAGQTVTDNSITWLSIYDPYRAVAIQVTVRFLDPHSGHMRQTTILHSLTN